MSAPAISQRAFNEIVAFEVSSRAEYEKAYQRPTWPGGASGVTVGIGYDLGYCTLDKLAADFDERLAVTMVRVMQRCLGVTGQAAREILPSVRNSILIPWDVAIAVFSDRDIPEWTAKVCKAIPGADKLPADCLGALVSLADNRGASFDMAGERYTEMRNIKRFVISGDLARIPDEIRAMKRLWGKDQEGLLIRRDKEAALFADGLVGRFKAVAPPDQPKVAPKSPPDVPPVEELPAAPAPTNWIGALLNFVLSLLPKGK